MNTKSSAAAIFSKPFQILVRPIPRSYVNFVGWKLLRLGELVIGLFFFSLITAGVLFRKWRIADQVIRPLIRDQVFLCGLRLLPLISLVAFALGFVVIAQTMAFLSQYGVTNYVGTVMVTVVIRELGPLVTAWLVLARVGTATAIDLGYKRAHGEIDALVSLGIDPVHYLVIPRVLGLSISIFCLTVYLIAIALASGYLISFLQDVPLSKAEYINQLVMALRWEDFPLLALKTVCFGVLIALIICYEGLAKPLQVEDISISTTRALLFGIELCVVLDILFIVLFVYLILAGQPAISTAAAP
jgi:phospholipid/cholesterol/gamma-HCH transport system permease protein